MRKYLFLIFLMNVIDLPAQDYSNFEWMVFDTANSILDNNWISDILVAPDGTGYVSTTGPGFYRFANNDLELLSIPEDYQNYWFKDMEWWDDHRILIAGMNEQMILFDTHTGRFEPIGIVSRIMYAAGNHKGNILFATHIGDYYPVFQLRDGQREGFGREHQDVMGMYIATNGDAFISYRDGTYRYPMEEDGTYAAENDILTETAFYDLELDSKGILWATSFSDLKLHSYDGKTWTTYWEGPDQLYYDWHGKMQYIANQLVVLPDDRIVITTQTHTGIGIFDGKIWEVYEIPGDVEFGGIYSIEIAPDGSILCGTNKAGLAVLKPSDN